MYLQQKQSYICIFFTFFSSPKFLFNEQNYNIAILIVRYVLLILLYYLLIRARDTKIALHRKIAICYACGAFDNN
jgi:hypothetical protein